MRAMALVLLVLGGCSVQRAPVEPENVTVTPPAEDGTRYIAVRSDGMTPPQTLARQWKREAKRTCDGDYVLINEAGGQTKRAGFTTERLHEGFVRCMIEDEEIGGTPEGASEKARE